MRTFDVDLFLRELDPQAPCGPNMEYEACFTNLEYASIDKPEVEYGNALKPACPPDWASVKMQSLNILGLTRDLRVVMLLLRANLALHGIVGLADSLTLLERLLEQRWDHLHPQLDLEDSFDPTLRVNSLATLSDTATVVLAVKDAPLLNLPIVGPFSLRVLEIANGEQPPAEGQEKISLSSLEAILRDVEDVHFSNAVENISRCYDSACNIEAQLVARLGEAKAPNLNLLIRPLKRGRDFLLQAFQLRSLMHTDVLADVVVETPDQPLSHPSRPVPGPFGEIGSRGEVLHALDQVLKYYEQHEPSSPVPLLLMRAKILVPKNFIEVMEDLAPDSLTHLLALSGTPRDSHA